MSAAVDTIFHNILLDILEEIGIADKALDLLNSYITNRTYRTLINDIQSDEFQLKYGVPQFTYLQLEKHGSQILTQILAIT